MAQRAGRPADGFERQTVAHRAVALHLDRFDAHPVGLDAVTIFAFQLLPEVITPAETRRHARDAAGRLQVHIVREFQPVVIDRPLAGRRARQLCTGSSTDERAEFGVAGAEITGVGQRRRMPRSLQPALHPVVAIGAEFLRCRGHRPRAFMLGMAIDAAPLRPVEHLADVRQQFVEPAVRRPRCQQHRRRRTGVRGAHRLMLAGVATDARLVGHRNKGFDMARLAIIFQAGVRARQRPRQPCAVGMKPLGALIDGLVAVPGPDRPDQKGKQHQHAERPRPDALAEHHALQRKGFCLVDILRRLRQLVDPLDEQDDLVILARDRQPVAAEAQLAARAAVDVGDGLAASVKVEPQTLARRDADMTPVIAADRRMLRVYRQVGDVDRVRTVAAERDRITRQRLIADDLLARLGRRNAAQDEAHRLRLTSKRRR